MSLNRAELFDKWWYRFVAVLFWLAVVVAVGFIFLIAWSERPRVDYSSSTYRAICENGYVYEWPVTDYSISIGDKRGTYKFSSVSQYGGSRIIHYIINESCDLRRDLSTNERLAIVKMFDSISRLAEFDASIRDNYDLILIKKAYSEYYSTWGEFIWMIAKWVLGLFILAQVVSFIFHYIILGSQYTHQSAIKVKKLLSIIWRSIKWLCAGNNMVAIIKGLLVGILIIFIGGGVTAFVATGGLEALGSTGSMMTIVTKGIYTLATIIGIGSAIAVFEKVRGNN